AIADGVITTDAAGRIEQLNPAAQRLTGWTEAEARGQPVETVVRLWDERDQRPLPLPTDAAIDPQSQALLADRQGSTCPIQITSAKIHNTAEQPVGTVLILHDISEQRRIL